MGGVTGRPCANRCGGSDGSRERGSGPVFPVESLSPCAPTASWHGVDGCLPAPGPWTEAAQVPILASTSASVLGGVCGEARNVDGGRWTSGRRLSWRRPIFSRACPCPSVSYRVLVFVADRSSRSPFPTLSSYLSRSLV